MSSVILPRLFPGAVLIRRHDKAWISPAPDRIIYDVDGQFYADAQGFDHHPRLNPLRDDGRLYSSFGLIWAQYGLACSRTMDER